MTILYLLSAFLSGGVVLNALSTRVLKPWARYELGRPLECDKWGLPSKKEDKKPPKGRCNYFIGYCGHPTNSTWDERCIEHTIYMDGGRP